MSRADKDRAAALAASIESQAQAKRENDKARHTPGPWQCLPEEADQDYIRIRGTRLGGRYKVANVHHLRYRGAYEDLRLRYDAETFANARLVAAAPDLLAALQEMYEAASDSDSCHYGTLSTTFLRKIARAAIVKATGEEP